MLRSVRTTRGDASSTQLLNPRHCSSSFRPLLDQDAAFQAEILGRLVSPRGMHHTEATGTTFAIRPGFTVERLRGDERIGGGVRALTAVRDSLHGSKHSGFTIQVVTGVAHESVVQTEATPDRHGQSGAVGIQAELLAAENREPELPSVIIAPDVTQFGAEAGLTDYLPIVAELVRLHFPTATSLRCEVEHDPDGDEAWLTFFVDVPSDMDAALQQYDRYTDALLDRIPWPEIDRFRLAFTVT